MFRRIWLRMFPKYRRLAFVFVDYTEADRLIREASGKPESERWVIAPEEDTNWAIGKVCIERRERILS